VGWGGGGGGGLRGAGGEAGCGLGVRPYVAGCDAVAPIVYSNGRTIIPLEGAESCRVAVWLLIIRAYLPV